MVPEAPRGVFEGVWNNTTPSEEEWTAPFLSGVVYFAGWDTVEPERDGYDWGRLDQVVRDAGVHGKQVILGIKPGIISGPEGVSLPPWYTGQTFTCDSGEIGPIPWDPEYVDEYREIMRALIQRYDAFPQVAGYILLSFHQWRYAEIGKICSYTQTPHDVARLVEPPYSYTRAKVQGAFLQLLSDVMPLTAKPFRFAINPILNEVSRQRSMQDTVDFFINPLVEAYPGRAVITKTNLTPMTADPLRRWNSDNLDEVEEEVYRHRPRLAWATETATEGGPVTLEDWWRTGDIGLHYGMQWLEIRRADVRNGLLAPVLTCLNTAMRAGSGHCGHAAHEGDVDGNGQVTLSDLRKLFRMLTGQEPANDVAKSLAPPTDRLSLADGRALIQLLVGG
jgi:hypothetical protein